MREQQSCHWSHRVTLTCEDPILQQWGCAHCRGPDKSSPSRVMWHKCIWLLFSNYIKPVLLKSVPSRDNALDAFNWLEEERGGKAMLA